MSGLLFFIFSGTGNADITDHSNLLGHSGYLTTPSAYITNALWSPGYSFFSRSFPLTRDLEIGKNSEIWNFSSSLGLFPFLEVNMSVFVLPQEDASPIVDNYGANKWRSFGAKAKLVSEKRFIPAVSVGMSDPELKNIGASTSSINISSSYIVLSKQLFSKNASISVGHGVGRLYQDTNRLRLTDFFGGFQYNAGGWYSVLCDYDGKSWTVGNDIRIKNVAVMFSYTEGDYFAARIGYLYDLLK